MLCDLVPFTGDDADEILVSLLEAGVSLPVRFVKPTKNLWEGRDRVIDEAEGLARVQWATSLDELRQALNDAALTGNAYRELVARPSLSPKDLRILRRSSQNILKVFSSMATDRLCEFKSLLGQSLSDEFDLGDYNRDTREFLKDLKKFYDAVCKVQADFAERKDQIKAKIDLPENADDASHRPTQQSYRIQRYTEVFMDVLELDPDAYTTRGHNNFRGAYPDFIRSVMSIDNGWKPEPEALTKALERAGLPKKNNS